MHTLTETEATPQPPADASASDSEWKYVPIRRYARDGSSEAEGRGAVREGDVIADPSGGETFDLGPSGGDPAHEGWTEIGPDDARAPDDDIVPGDMIEGMAPMDLAAAELLGG